ncbi:T9SS type A sorting domain-containing protein [Aquimarina spongiae]|uniref:Por secretion system C-terminal sorting domain-containing protein n=1 Tax=Aquimarina spongiae TaxID=570521 RepID=A0A1M6F0Q7_9FLAO|nr:T9SS type A sorting domain-containing protein [Aquimarina spongiae]SHI91267.1 Por secretion system C-terminal sorting domain-containing protein [Aquimarina spongiae]
MKKLHIIAILFALFSVSVTAQVTINATVSCPPCRPVEGCGVCWENQQQANQCEQNRINNNVSKEKMELIVRSNPISDGNLSLTGSFILSGKIVILDQLGATVKTIDLKNRKSNHLILNLNLESGLYFMIYYDYDRQQKITKKLVFTK